MEGGFYPLVPACRRGPFHVSFSTCKTHRTAQYFTSIQSCSLVLLQLGLLPGQFPWEASHSFRASGCVFREGCSGSCSSGSWGGWNLDRVVVACGFVLWCGISIREGRPLASALSLFSSDSAPGVNQSLRQHESLPCLQLVPPAVGSLILHPLQFHVAMSVFSFGSHALPSEA